ncbi:unnamed protein product [Adineta ricciae]|uniref:Uncharacterized protein n=1 Tax=Adineta ricciae TaxID=249248 RepID=A0A814GAC0_ADIRI|nr:unnamed protein product [Adineta ricciae]
MSWKEKLRRSSTEKSSPPSSSIRKGGIELSNSFVPNEIQENTISTPSSTSTVHPLQPVASFSALGTSAQQWAYQRGAQSALATTDQIEADIREARNIIANYSIESLELLHLVDRWIQQLLNEFLQQREHFKHQLMEIWAKEDLTSTQYDDNERLRKVYTALIQLEKARDGILSRDSFDELYNFLGKINDNNFSEMKEKFNSVLEHYLNILHHLSIIDKELKFGNYDNHVFDIKDKLLRLKKRFDKEYHTICIVGLEKAGKSTFINALLGHELLPTASERCTQIRTVIKPFLQTNDAQLCAKIHFYDDNHFRVLFEKMAKKSNETEQQFLHRKDEVLRKRESLKTKFPEENLCIDAHNERASFIKQLNDYITGEVYVNIVKEVEIYTSKLPGKNYELLDVPGFDSPIKEHRDAAIEAIRSADTFLFLTSGQQPSLTGPQINLLQEIQQNHLEAMQRAFGIITKLDLCQTAAMYQEHYEKTFAELIEKRFKPDRIYATCSRLEISNDNSEEFHVISRKLQSFGDNLTGGFQRCRDSLNKFIEWDLPKTHLKQLIDVGKMKLLQLIHERIEKIKDKRILPENLTSISIEEYITQKTMKDWDKTYYNDFFQPIFDHANYWHTMIVTKERAIFIEDVKQKFRETFHDVTKEFMQQKFPIEQLACEQYTASKLQLNIHPIDNQIREKLTFDLENHMDTTAKILAEYLYYKYICELENILNKISSPTQDLYRTKLTLEKCIYQVHALVLRVCRPVITATLRYSYLDLSAKQDAINELIYIAPTVAFNIANIPDSDDNGDLLGTQILASAESLADRSEMTTSIIRTLFKNLKDKYFMLNYIFVTNVRRNLHSVSMYFRFIVPMSQIITPKKENEHDFLVVWLHDAMDNDNEDYQNTLTQLRCITTEIHSFIDSDQCIEFILDDTADTKVYLIVSVQSVQHFVPCIHDISQIESIFILCNTHSHSPDEQWMNKWFKVKGVYTDIVDICRQIVHQGLDQLDPSFMYTQIIKEILLTIKFEDKHIKEFVNYYCDAFVNNETDRNKVKQLEKKYHQESPIWWYTTERFLYGMLNRALRVMDGEVITLMGFFINDLHRHIDQLHKKQFDNGSTVENFTVCRGQGLTKRDFDELVKSKGGLMSFNNFLSTSRNIDVSLLFASANGMNENIVSVLFVMEIDPQRSTVVFASIRDISQFPQEDEILFSMHSIFRIHDIKPMEGNTKVHQVDLSLTSDNDEELCTLTEQVREESFPNAEGWFRLGLVLAQMKQCNTAERIYRALADQNPELEHEAFINNQLGLIKHNQGQYEQALVVFQKSLNMLQRLFPHNHSNIASSYNNIALVYADMGDYPKALSAFEKILKIQLQSLPPDHLDIATFHNNIGTMCKNMSNYPKAFSSHQQALHIRQQSLPPNHPDIADSYNNIGNVYAAIGDYLKALSSYRQALEIYQQSQLPNHPDIAKSYNNIGSIYKNMGVYNKALESHEEALKIRQKSLPSNHLDIATSYNNIGNVYIDIGDYPKALSSHQKALTICKQSLPSNHPYISDSYDSIGNIYSNMGDYPEALSSYKQALEIQQKSLSLDHPHISASYNNIGNAYKDMGDYPKAILFHEQALKLRQQSLSPNHSDIADSYNNIAVVYSALGDYSKALELFKKSLKICQQSLPSNHLDTASSYNNVGAVYFDMGDYSNAYLHYMRALQIGQTALPPTHPHLQIYIRNVDEARNRL